MHPHRVQTPLRGTAVVNDLAERLERSQDPLRVGQLDFQLIIDSIPAPVAVIAPNGQVETLNEPSELVTIAVRLGLGPAKNPWRQAEKPN